MLIIGMKVGRLTLVEAINGTGKQRSPHAFRCQCDCGSEKQITAHDLKKTRSCGCWKRERMAALTQRHGMAHSAEYRIWHAMINRCTHSYVNGFKYYGGRGIRVCERWRKDFAAFYADMGPRPSSNHSVDRRDNDLDYTPDNCKWSTSKSQANNRRSTRRLCAFGKTQSVSEWAREYGLEPQALFARLRKGVNLEDALTIPLGDCAALRAAKHL